MHNRPEIRRNATVQGYGVTHPDVLRPTGMAETLMSYSRSDLTAAVGFKDRTSASITMGFPFESITTDRERDKLMRAILKYLTEN
jgi:hypothetical protein